jgi:hypothetical protein
MALCNHSQVQKPTHKETHFFAQTRPIIEENTNWYLEVLRAHEGKISVDASTAYMADDKCPSILKQYFPESKILILLRDPAKRAFSSYIHMQRKTPRADRRKFCDILESLESGGNKSLLEMETQAVHQAWQTGLLRDYLSSDYHERKFGAPFCSSFRDPLWVYRYFSYGQYSRVVEAYESVFDDVKIVVFERLLREPDAVLLETAQFLGIDEGGLQLPHAHESRVPSTMGRIYVRVREQGKLAAHSLNILRDAFDALMEALGAAPLTAKARRLLRRKPELKERQYIRARCLLRREYEYWRSRRPLTENLWQY